MTDRTPTTEAGRALLKRVHGKGDLPQWAYEDDRDAILAIEAEAASGPALTTGDVAKALIESDLIPRYLEYARLSPSMNPAETVEHIAATWAPRILARLAPAAAEPAEALRLRNALQAVLDHQFTVQVGGHDVDCDLVQTSGLPCSCGYNDAIREGYAVLAARPAPEEKP